MILKCFHKILHHVRGIPTFVASLGKAGGIKVDKGQARDAGRLLYDGSLSTARRAMEEQRRAGSGLHSAGLQLLLPESNGDGIFGIVLSNDAFVEFRNDPIVVLTGMR